MDNIELNSYEGKIETIVWPFYRYNVLIPKQTKVDLFVWLFLSIYIQQCQVYKRDKKVYDITTEIDTRKIIQNRFPEVINAQIMDLIVSKIKSDFVYLDKQNKKLTFKEETFSFVKTYQELFNKELQIKYMYQCALTGDVVPYFGDEIIENDENKAPYSVDDQRTPTIHAIKEAIKKFVKLDKINRSDMSLASKDENVEYFDEFSESFFDDENDDEFTTEVKKNINKDDFAVQIVDGYKTQVNYRIKVFVEDNELKVTSPFTSYTNNWMNRKFLQAQNSNQGFKDIIAKINQKWIIPEEVIDNRIKLASNNWEKALSYTAPLMKLVLALGKKRLINNVYHIDQYFNLNDYDPYWINIGKYLEGLFRELPKNNNKDKSFDFYKMLLETYGNQNKVDVNDLLKIRVYENWKNDSNNLKSRIIDAIFEHNWLKGDSVYNEVICDIFKLYSIRNSRSHFNTESVEKPSTEHIDKLYKITIATKDLI